jgi:hypothetical protein
MTIAHLSELGSGRCDALIATGMEALRKSGALAAGLLSGPLWKNGRVKKKAMLGMPEEIPHASNHKRA